MKIFCRHSKLFLQKRPKGRWRAAPVRMLKKNPIPVLPAPPSPPPPTKSYQCEIHIETVLHVVCFQYPHKAVAELFAEKISDVVHAYDRTL